MVDTTNNAQPKRRGRPPQTAPPDPVNIPLDPSGEVLLDTMRTVLREQLASFVTHVDDQIGGIQAKVVSLEQRIPDSQALVDKVAAVLGPALSLQINEKLQGVVMDSANGHKTGGDTGGQVTGQKPPLSQKLTEITDVVSAVCDVVLKQFYPLYLDHRKEARLDRQEVRADKLLDSNPVAMRDAMMASNSPLLPYWSMVFAPPPQAVADARVRETTDALLVGMRAKTEATRVLREDQARQRETLSPSSPSSSGKPTSDSTPSPTNPNAPKSDGVTMTSESKPNQKNQPRLTLREVMG